MRVTQFTLGIASFILAALFLAFDIFNISFMLARTSVSIYPVIFFTILGVVLVASYRRRQERSDRSF